MGRASPGRVAPHVGLLVGGPELVCDPGCLWMETGLHGDRRSGSRRDSIQSGVSRGLKR